ncbi:hypothetical protein ACW9IF_08250 [Pseudomonas tolaasii]
MGTNMKRTLDEFVAGYQTPTESAWINDLAIRSFRDIGDGDYIAARLALRASLPTQAIWSGLQAVEKYLKCMLLLGRVSSKNVGHDLNKGLRLVNERLRFDISLPDRERKVFEHLADSEGDRYLVSSVFLLHDELPGLDALIWRLRQYCVPLGIKHYNDTPTESVLLANLAELRERLEGAPTDGYIPNGLLEKVLAEEGKPAHEGLVWRNAMFGNDEPISPGAGLNPFVAINSPLYLHPEIARPVSELIRLPAGALEAFETLAATKKR